MVTTKGKVAKDVNACGRGYLYSAAVAVLAAVIASAGTLKLVQDRSVAAPCSQCNSSLVRHLFSTPIFHENIKGKVDAPSMAEVALDGYTQVRDDAALLLQIRKIKYDQCMTLGHSKHMCGGYLNGDWKSALTYNDAFFTWQMSQGDKRVRRWRGMPRAMVFGSSSVSTSDNTPKAVDQFMKHLIELAIPKYFNALGISADDVPKFIIQAWAAVSEQASHTHVLHEHFSHGDCLLSGTFYPQAPEGSGPISFPDLRKTRRSKIYNSVPKEFFPGRSYAHVPRTGDLLLFPPWASHEVKRSRFGADSPARVVWAFNALVDRQDDSLPRLTRDWYRSGTKTDLNSFSSNGKGNGKGKTRQKRKKTLKTT